MITVGIAVHNEENRIAKVIELWQNEPIDELLIISSGSTDNTNKIIKQFRKTDNRIRLITEHKKNGKPKAINKILKEAKHEILIMTDGDVFIQQGITKQLIKHFEDKEVGLVAGHITPNNDNILFDISCTILHLKRKEDLEFDVSGNLYAIRTNIVKNIPDDMLVDDVYIAYKIKEAGYQLKYEPGAIVKTDGATTIDDYIDQKTRTRIGWLQLRYRYGIRTTRSIFGELKYLRQILALKWLVDMPCYLIFNLIAWLRAYYQFWTEKDYIKLWRPIKSTKR